MEIIASNKGKEKVAFEGYMYTKQDTRSYIRWRCVRRTHRCKGTMTTSLQLTDPVSLKPHNHDPDHAAVSAIKCITDMKRKAATTEDNPSLIYNNNLNDLSAEVKALLPSEEAIKRTLRNQRSKIYPPVLGGRPNQRLTNTDPLTPDESAFETLSSPNTLIQYESLSQPSSAKFQKISRKQFGDQSLEVRRQMASTLMAAPSQLTPRKVSASAVKRAAKSEPLKKPQEKRIFVVANHQRCIMSNMASLWKSGKLCDAGIGNGSSTVMVHKVVLSAVCPKLLSAFSADMFSHKFMQVNFPEKVSKEALTAFAEYMYNGLLNLDCDILEQLKLIANKLDMTEFEELCDSHLPKHMHQPASASASFTDVPLVQTTTPEVDIKQVISEDELTQVLLSQESEVASLALNKSANATSSLISPSIKTEPVEPEDDKYGHCSSSNQAFTPTTSSSTITEATTASTSVPESSTEFAIPLSKTTDVKSTKLKATHSKEEAPLVSDLSCAAGSVETVHSQSSSMNEDSSKPSKSSVDGPSTSTSDKEVSPIGLFVPGGDNLCLLASQTVDGKTIELYNTDLT